MRVLPRSSTGIELAKIVPLDLTTFRRSLAAENPPPGLSIPLRALWWDAKGSWDKAHRCAQSDEGTAGAWVHAYLHRKEGDVSNASYWYGRAGRDVPKVSFEAEWEGIARELLEACV